MGSSSSIMQATLAQTGAGGGTDGVNSTITFHCQELREAGELPMATRTDKISTSLEELIDRTMTSPQKGMPSPEAVLSPNSGEEPGAVTRYFPIIQPATQANFIPRVEIVEHGMLPNFVESGPDSKQTKENYYYSCDICSKGFMFKGSLNRHIARHVQHGGEEVRSVTRKFPIANRSGLGNNEVRYQLKDPRLYEQHAKLQPPNPQKEKKSRSGEPTTKPYPGPRKGRGEGKCSLCDSKGHSPSSCKTFPRNLLLGQKVLAICSCLKCNKSFDDVDKLKDHISKCQGFNRPKPMLQSECNVR